jgi:hypothetical protein
MSIFGDAYKRIFGGHLNADILASSLMQLIILKPKIVKIEWTVTFEDGNTGKNTVYLEGYSA